MEIGISSVASAISATRGAVEIIKFLKTRMNLIHDEVATGILELNQKILDIQIAIMEVNEVVFEKTEELRKIRKSLAQKDNYTLVDLGKSQFVYRYNIPPVRSDGSDEIQSEPPHDICQRCLDEKGIKSVLQRRGAAMGAVQLLRCDICNRESIL